MTEVFKLYASCIPVKGYSRSLICDVQRGEIFEIPEGLYEILTDHADKHIDDIKEYYNHEVDAEIDHYVQYLINNELGFFCDNPDAFPPLNKTWQSPEIISNAIISINDNLKLNYHDIFDQLSKLGCKYLEIRAFDGIDFIKLTEILSHCQTTTLRNIDIITKHHSSFETLDFNQFFLSNQRVGLLTLYNSKMTKPANLLEPLRLRIIERNIGANIHCGNINKAYFAINREMFFESQLFNSCLNKKLSIDVEGNVSNCPSMTQKYGNVLNKKLVDILNETELKTYWGITKDSIPECSICEYRYICTDCRAYVEKPNDIYSKPLKCGYDPKTNKWESWSTNPLKKNAIVHYQLQDAVE